MLRTAGRAPLEEEPKDDLYHKLKKATRGTEKEEYTKIKHASELLEMLDPAKVGRRCPRFSTFIQWLTQEIENA